MADARWSRLRDALGAEGCSRGRRALMALAALAIAAAGWLPCLHFFYAPGLGTEKVSDTFFAPPSPLARKLAARHLALWTDPGLRAREINRMRSTCEEWDFMGRTFTVLALCNLALREPAEKARSLEAADHIIAETLAVEKDKDFTFFLMNYGQDKNSFVEQPARSLFVDGEIALMLGARRLAEERPDYAPLMQERVAIMAARMAHDPVLCAESYPDECWMFCNTVALAAMRMSDALDGTDHSALFRQWVAVARKKLVEPKTGLLISSFSLKGRVGDGPRGSSIWMAAHCLQLVDEDFAREQYAGARRELGRSLLGFGYAREWPAGCGGEADVDSGAVVPVLGASPSSSGLALVAAAAFGDGQYYRQLATSLGLGGYPVETAGGALHYAASNQVGDAAIFYSAVLGPVWARARLKPEVRR